MKWPDMLDWDSAFEWFIKGGCFLVVLAVLSVGFVVVMGLVWLIKGVFGVLV